MGIEDWGLGPIPNLHEINIINYAYDLINYEIKRKLNNNNRRNDNDYIDQHNNVLIIKIRNKIIKK